MQDAKFVERSISMKIKMRMKISPSSLSISSEQLVSRRMEQSSPAQELEHLQRYRLSCIMHEP